MNSATRSGTDMAIMSASTATLNSPVVTPTRRTASQLAELHREAEQRPFMQAFFAGALPRPAYVAWLARQWHLYRTLERALDSLPPGSPEHGVVPAVLHRTARIEADLDHLTGRSWREQDHLTPATRSYVERIESVAGFGAGVVAHAWLRYMGNVGGREVLRRLVAATVGALDGDDRGLSFTDYSAVGEVRPFFATFHARLDALPLDADAKARAVAEADAAFRHNIAFTDELARAFDIAAPVG
jgi:heme oxygenase